jgi:hypothetical protein
MVNRKKTDVKNFERKEKYNKRNNKGFVKCFKAYVAS